MPSREVYHTSSVVARVFPINTSSFTAVSHMMLAGDRTVKETTSFGCDAVLITPTTVPFAQDQLWNMHIRDPSACPPDNRERQSRLGSGGGAAAFC